MKKWHLIVGGITVAVVAVLATLIFNPTLQVGATTLMINQGGTGTTTWGEGQLVYATSSQLTGSDSLKWQNSRLVFANSQIQLLNGNSSSPAILFSVGTTTPTNVGLFYDGGLGFMNAGVQSFRADNMGFLAVTGTATYPAYSFFNDANGDQTGGMYSPASNQIAWSTSGTEKIRLLANGNLGIGTTTPSVKLTVEAGSGDGIVVTKSGLPMVAMGSGTSSAGVVVVYDSAGKNTIITPGNSIDMRDNSNVVVSRYAAAGSSWLAGGRFGSGTSSLDAQMVLQPHELGMQYIFKIWDETGTNVLHLIDRNGYVGILNSSPSQPLTIGSSGQFTVDVTGNIVGKSLTLINGGIRTAVLNTASSTVLDETNSIISVTTSSVVITLPSANGIDGREFTVDNASTGNITVTTTGSETINGTSPQTIPSNSSITVFSNGTNWRIK